MRLLEIYTFQHESMSNVAKTILCLGLTALNLAKE